MHNRIEVEQSTIEYALNVLNLQYGHIEKCNSPRQEAYYRGLYNMLEMIVTQAYATGTTSLIEKGGEHSIRFPDGHELHKKEYPNF